MKGSESCVNAFQLATLSFPEPKPIVQQLIVPGVTLLVGASKIGKSWLTLDMCVSIATGAPFLLSPRRISPQRPSCCGGTPPATGRELARQIESLMQKHPTELGFRVQTGMRATSGVRGINIVPV